MLADDLAVLADSAAALQQFVDALAAACARWGLVISQTKTELMLVGGPAATACQACGRQNGEARMLLCDGCNQGWHLECLPQPLDAVPDGTWLCLGCEGHQGPWHDPLKPPIAVGGHVLEWVDKFKYLGSIFDSNDSVDAEVSHRIQLAAAAFHRLLRPFFQQRCIPRITRITVYKVMVISVLLYGSEAWALTARQLERLEVFHRACLRRILGVRRRDHISNARLHDRSRTQPIADLLAWRQLRWLGHLGRMGDDRLAKQMLYTTMAGPGRRRRVGQPHTRLTDTYMHLVQERVVQRQGRHGDRTCDRGRGWLALSHEPPTWCVYCQPAPPRLPS
jgi:hypothetical protein